MDSRYSYAASGYRGSYSGYRPSYNYSAYNPNSRHMATRQEYKGTSSYFNQKSIEDSRTSMMPEQRRNMRHTMTEKKQPTYTSRLGDREPDAYGSYGQMALG